MRATQQRTWRQIVVAVGLNQWENEKQALHLYQHRYVVPMEKLSPQSPLAARLNVWVDNQGACMQLPSLLPLNA
jgi:hypothetical protein